jgi:hypothetical protein
MMDILVDTRADVITSACALLIGLLGAVALVAR